MNIKAAALGIILSLLLLPTAGFAASPWMEKTTYAEKTEGKFVFGVTNVLIGWTDLFVEPKRYHDEGKNVWAGVGKGLVDTVVNEVGGAFHLATFFIPVDFALPENGVDLSGTSQPSAAATG